MTYVNTFSQQCSLVHQLLGYTAYIDAGSSETPFSALWWRCHIVQHGDFSAQVHCLFGTREPTRATTNDRQVIVEISIYNLYYHFVSNSVQFSQKVYKLLNFEVFIIV